MTISGNFEHFECFNFETDFLESENLFQKAGVPHHLHTKTVISEANIKANRTMSTKWTYHKERSFSSNYLIFLKFCFSLGTSCKELIRCTNDPNAHIHTFC